jgi:hypothetical protein
MTFMPCASWGWIAWARLGRGSPLFWLKSQ